MTYPMTRTRVLLTYLTHMLLWALLGATSTYVLLLGVFSWVAYSEGLPLSLLPVPGFFYLCVCVGAFIGGASGVEAGQTAVYERAADRCRCMTAHPDDPTPCGCTPLMERVRFWVTEFVNIRLLRRYTCVCREH